MVEAAGVNPEFSKKEFIEFKEKATEILAKIEAENWKDDSSFKFD